MRRSTHITLTAILIIVPAFARAEILQITPITVDSSAPVEQALKENKGRASTSIQGKGRALRLTYQSSETLTLFMVPLTNGNDFVPTDYLMLTLPATDGSNVEIDLTPSPGWTPLETKWLLQLLTKDEDANAGFSSLEFVPVSAPHTFMTALRHLFTVEPYTPSSFHALHGYRIFSVDVTVIAGILLLVISTAMLAFAASEKKLPLLVLVLLSFQALYGLRFGLDALRFTGEHVLGYAAGEYDEAGSVYRIAEHIRSRHDTTAMVFVCRSGTNYKEKILRYFAYPVRVSSEPADTATADYVLIMNAMDWSAEPNGVRCNDVSVKAQKLAEFPDGSVLFARTK